MWMQYTELYMDYVIRFQKLSTCNKIKLHLEFYYKICG